MTELLAGLSLGLGAGLAPGPLLTLVMTSTLERGFGAGVRVAMAPLLTDAPIIGLTVGLVSSVSDAWLQALGVGGGILLASLGLRTIVHRADAQSGVESGSADLWRGVVVNAISPHPWLFWVGVGAPLLVTAWRDAPGRGMSFLFGFYALLIGSKIAIAAVVAHGRQRITEQWRIRLVVSGGALLMLAGGVLVWEGTVGRL